MQRVAMLRPANLLHHGGVQQIFTVCRPAVVGTVYNTIIRSGQAHGKFIWPHFAARFAICRNQLSRRAATHSTQSQSPSLKSQEAGPPFRAYYKITADKGPRNSIATMGDGRCEMNLTVKVVSVIAATEQTRGSTTLRYSLLFGTITSIYNTLDLYMN